MTHNYPLKSLYGDYVRSVIGLVFLGVPFFFSIGNMFMSVILGGLTLLFLVFGIRTAIRHFSVIETSPQGIVTIGPLGRRIAWSEITKVDLKYFSTSRDKNNKDGWMQLKICGIAGCLKIESNLTDFGQIAAQTANAGFANSAEMNETTVENFTAMGVTVSLPDEDEE